jgi:transcriptional regulator with XRE-family HTH domain
MTTRVKRKIRRPGAEQKRDLDLITIGRKIRQLRGFDTEQAEFARMLGISQSQLSKYERGVTEPPLKVLVRLKDRFGKSLDWFVSGEG